MVIESTKSLAPAGFPARPPPPEIMERMVQSAKYGRQMLQSATAQSNPDTRPSTGGSDKDVPAIKRQVKPLSWIVLLNVNASFSSLRSLRNMLKKDRLALVATQPRPLSGGVVP